MEFDLTKKISLKEHFLNIKKMVQIIYSMDKSYLAMVCVVHIIRASIPYIGLFLSAYILDGFSKGHAFMEIFQISCFCCLAIFSLQFIANTLWNHLEVRKKNLCRLYDCMVQEKLLFMDYSKINSPQIIDLQTRIRRDNAWDGGMESVLYAGNQWMGQMFQLLGAIVLSVPLFAIMLHSRNVVFLLIFFVIIFILVIFIKLGSYFEKKTTYYCDHILTEKEKKEQLDYCWAFAQGKGYNDRNGKDIRIYNGYRLMEHWTTDVLRRPAVRKHLMTGVCGGVGEHACWKSLDGMALGVSYFVVALLAVQGFLGIGNVVKFAGCLNRFLQGTVGFGNMAAILAAIVRRQVSTIEFLEISDEMYKGKLPLEKRSDNEYQIEFRDVSFRYPGSTQYALRHFTMKLRIGEKLAVVGRNGSGKTTMIKLLCRLYDPEEGEILLNGVDIKKFKQEEYRRLFSVVFQDHVLFPFPLGQNVAVAVEYDKRRVEDCLVGAGLKERLLAMPEGLETYLYTDYDDSGIQISGGEAQKAALARAVYKDAPFVLLDEPTAALDPVSEYEVYTSFDRIVGSKTAIYISHRLSSCRFCEKIAVFEDGQLVQCGTHKELLEAEGGLYHQMWNAQAQYYQEN